MVGWHLVDAFFSHNYLLWDVYLIIDESLKIKMSHAYHLKAIFGVKQNFVICSYNILFEATGHKSRQIGQKQGLGHLGAGK